MNKKGISPLIATVLIIGFTVALTTTVMIWGKTFITEKTQKVGAESDARMRCINIEFTADKSCKKDANTITVGLRNLKSETIDGFTFRSTELPDLISKKEELKAIATKEYDLAITKTIKTLDVVPLVKMGSDYLPCSVETKTVRITTC